MDTNVRNNRRIREALGQGKQVEIYFYRDSGLMKFGGFHLNMAAGLEDSLIRDLVPPWNGGRKEIPDQEAEIPQSAPIILSEVMPTDDPVSDESDQGITDFVNKPITTRKMSTNDIRQELRLLFVEAVQRKLTHIDVRSGELSKRVNAQNQMPQVCSAMRSLMSEGDEILESPPKGNVSRLVVRFKFPRPI